MFDELAPWLATCDDADILCLQEVTHTPTADGWTRFDDAERSLPQRADLLADVRSRLPRHHGLFSASDSGPVHDHERQMHRQNFGLATFVSRTLTPVGMRAAFVHGDYAEHHDRWPSEGRPRAALAVRVFDRRAGRFVTVVNFHGLRDASGKADTPARRAQAERLADFVADAREKGDLTVVCGDFNVLPDSRDLPDPGRAGTGRSGAGRRHTDLALPQARTTRELPARFRIRRCRTVRDRDHARGVGPPFLAARPPALSG